MIIFGNCTHEMFFDEYINYKIVHYLSHCRVISL
jgi:hypothetical protein